MKLISYQLNHQNFHLSAINQTKLDDIWTAHLLTPREGKKKLFQPSGSSNLCNLPNFLATKSPDPKGLRVPLAPVQLVNPIQCPSQSQSFAILECQFAVVFHFFDQLVFGSFFFSVNLRFGEKTKTRLEVASDGH